LFALLLGVETGDISGLRVEQGKSVGFEEWPIDKIFTLNEDEKKFISLIYSPEFLDLFNKMKKYINK
jgi:hypothetical protein